jgi:hypothetical protein
MSEQSRCRDDVVRSTDSSVAIGETLLANSLSLAPDFRLLTDRPVPYTRPHCRTDARRHTVQQLHKQTLLLDSRLMHRNRCSWFSSGDCRGVRSVSFVVSLTTADILAGAGLQCHKAVKVRDSRDLTKPSTAIKQSRSATAVTLQSLVLP